MDQPAHGEPRRSLAALLREARTTVIVAIRRQLAQRGFKDMPRDGVFAISAIRDCEIGAGELGRRMGVSKQAVSQLLDTLVARGYVERSVDGADRRRTKLKLTRRGARVALLCRRTVDRLERQLIKTVGAIYVKNARATLTALIDLAADLESVTIE